MNTSLLSRLTVAAWMLCAGISEAQVSAYVFTDLGTLGGFRSEAYGINSAGQVVGYSYTSGDPAYGLQRAFITGPNGVGMRDLGTLGESGSFSSSSATGINSAGQVVGSSYISSTIGLRAFITGPNGVGMRDLGSLGGWSFATGINSAGQVVGGSYTSEDMRGLPRAFITGPNGIGMTDLGTLGGSGSSATGINSAGQVVGVSDTSGNAYRRAFITGPNGAGMRDLGTLGTLDNSYPRGINSAGQVVGESTNQSIMTGVNPNPGFITGPNGIGMTDLGTFGGSATIPMGINSAGQVVGVSYTSGNDPRFFITGPNGVGMTDLNSLVSLPAGVVLGTPTGINDAGQIIGIAKDRAFLLTPITASVPLAGTLALMLGGIGLIGVAQRQKTSQAA
jgi:probable HAF family extracellular repeat protein